LSKPFSLTCNVFFTALLVTPVMDAGWDNVSGLFLGKWYDFDTGAALHPLLPPKPLFQSLATDAVGDSLQPVLVDSDVHVCDVDGGSVVDGAWIGNCSRGSRSEL